MRGPSVADTILLGVGVEKVGEKGGVGAGNFRGCTRGTNVVQYDSLASHVYGKHYG